MKKFLVSLFVIMMSVTLVATAKTKLTMYAYLEVSNEINVKNFNEVLDGFKKLHPDIELEIEYGFDEAYHNKLQALAVANDLPDLLFLWPGKRTGHITSRGLIKDLRPFMKDMEGEFASLALAGQGPNGEVWELPEQITATHVLYTNNRILKELGLEHPKTFEEMKAQSQKIRDAGYIHLTAGNRSSWVMQSCLMSTLVDRMGGTDWFDKAISGKGASFADEPMVKAFQILQELEESKIFVPGINQMARQAALADFTNGRAVYFMEGGWMTNEIIKTMKKEDLPHVTLNTFPTIAGQKGIVDSTSGVPGTGYGMNANLTGEKAEAAWKWIYFYAGPEGGKIKITHNLIPAVKVETPADTPDLTKKLMNFLVEKPMTYVLDNKMDGEGMGVLHPSIQEVILGVKTPEEAAQEYEEWVAANDSARK